jgi:hypothetical protein
MGNVRNQGNRIRTFQPSDIQVIDEIWKRHHSNDFSVPNRSNSIIDAVIEGRTGEVVAYGQVKLFGEAVFILDKDAPKRDKIEALKLLMSEAIRGADSVGLEDLYCFIRDPAFATLISKHFGFEIVEDPGELLLRRL